jgi:competence protein ComEA
MKNKKLLKIFIVSISFCLLLTLNAIAADTKSKAPDMPETGKLQAAAIEPVNINKADVKALTTLKGIGKDRAQKIVEYREKNGPFQKPEDLMKVKGIGKKIFDQNKESILI